MSELKKVSGYESQLQSALSKLGVESDRNLVIPGNSNFEVDLYLPQLPRAAIEIKRIGRLPVLDKELAHLQHVLFAGRRELGDNFIIIFVAIIQSTVEFDSIPTLLDGIELIIVRDGDDGSPDMAIAAAAINQLLKDRRSRLWLPEMPLVAALSAAIPLSAIGSGVLAVPVLMSATSLVVSTIFGKRNEIADQAAPTGYLDAKVGQSSSPLPAPPSKQSVDDVSKLANIIIATFQELSGNDSSTAAHELACLIEEFRLGHFTACALRAGRCLESMIYFLSHKWGIELHDSAFGHLDEIQRSIDLVSRRLGEMGDTAPASGSPAETKLDEALVNLSNKTSQAIIAIKNSLAVTSCARGLKGGPRPPVALLKRIGNKYGALDGVGKTISELIAPHNKQGSKSILDSIIDVRNRAAHARHDGHPEEIEETIVFKMINDINVVLLKLSNIGVTIHSHLARC